MDTGMPFLLFFRRLLSTNRKRAILEVMMEHLIRKSRD
jgi:hypothetical protein